ncbi:MAG: hypothetical protein H6550_09320 [Chitinophagales bacterium]|nr:hypothetical protein [Chitinophagales bacterium]
MRRTAQILMLLLVAITAPNAFADEKDQDKEKAKKPKPVPVPVYIGNSDIDSGVISKQLFDSLLRQGFTSRDSNGRVFDVKSFMFTYCERNLYEDSIGNPMILTDYLSEFCFDNKLKDYQLEGILSRSKWGDTLILEKITLNAADSTKAGAHGKQVKLTIGK